MWASGADDRNNNGRKQEENRSTTATQGGLNTVAESRFGLETGRFGTGEC